MSCHCCGDGWCCNEYILTEFINEQTNFRAMCHGFCSQPACVSTIVTFYVFQLPFYNPSLLAKKLISVFRIQASDWNVQQFEPVAWLMLLTHMGGGMGWGSNQTWVPWMSPWFVLTTGA